MKILILTILCFARLSYAAMNPQPLKGTLSTYDKKFATVVNNQGSYQVPVEYFSKIESISLGSSVTLSLDEDQFKKIKYKAPTLYKVGHGQ